ncbi:MAG: DUF3089 domain-containing protein [Candidatus Delongbacteria bacterium]|jgi:pimeloyl-ACP methyl ester carboxylesterase|nr:DUF3089 domain-containing protein [Candidatus Delongbacteria bacterium]
MKISLKLLSVFIVIIYSLSFLSCDKSNPTEPTDPNIATDYSKVEHWLSIPTTLSPVDIFYYYPTAWQKVNESDPIICEIDNPSMLIGAPSAFGRQATAFETAGNVYAPYYRQDDAVSTLLLPSEEQAEVVGGIPTMDAIAAFDYYIKHFNDGRPYILVGHSQGAIVLSNLLSEYMKENPSAYENMIAAYVIGWPITADYLAKNPHLKYAEGPYDTGVIISYNTQSPNMSGVNPLLDGKIGIVINPITWTRDETLATVEEGLGSFMPDANMVPEYVPQFADARVNIAKGVLECSTAADDEFIAYIVSMSGLPEGVYHSFDIPFYYYNLRQNAENRANKFLGK